MGAIITLGLAVLAGARSVGEGLMNTKTLTGTYDSGYTLSTIYSALSITSSGVVRGTTATAYGDVGGEGVVANAAASVTNNGAVVGGGGAVGAKGGGEGGAGGVGLVLGAGGGVDNSNQIYGGNGGAGGQPFGGGRGGQGGAGGDAIDAAASTYVKNSYYIIAGAGGAGAAGTYGGAGGAGGAGVNLAAGGYVVNSELISGGLGGSGGEGLGDDPKSGGVGADGGVGVTMASAGTVSNQGGTITGGAAGPGGYYNTDDRNVSGNGGDGIALAKGGTVNNSGQVSGGSAIGGQGGSGVILGAAGEVVNDGTIVGAYGLFHGGGGVYFEGRGTLLNSGEILGGQAPGYSRDGIGVLLGDGGSIDNTGTIKITDINIHGSFYRPTSVGVSLAEGGDLTNGPGGYISGYFGVEADSAGATVTNFGTILGHTRPSVSFSAASDRLISEAGSGLVGFASGGGVATVELASGTGTITGLGNLGIVSVAETVEFYQFASYVLDAGGSWTLAGANILNAGQSMTSEAALVQGAGSTLTVENGASFADQGPIANAGTIGLSSTGSATEFRVLAAGATLSGGGQVAMSGAKAEILGGSSTATLTNVDNTIVGTGYIGAGVMTLDNEAAGVIAAMDKGSLTVDTKGETLANAGVMEATGGGTLVVDASTVRQQATGAILAAPGSRVDLEDDDIVGGAVGSSGTGLVAVNVAGGEFDGSAGAVILTGVIEVLNGSNLILNGAILNTAKLEAYPARTRADLIIGPNGATLSGGGQIGLINVNNRVYGQSATDTLTNVNDRIDGAGQLGDGKLVLVNDAAGVIIGNETTALTIDTGTATIDNAGLIENVGAGGVVVQSAIDNTGTLFAAGGTLVLEDTVTGAGIGKINGGTLEAVSTFSENVAFAGATGVLELVHSQSYTGAITGFSKTGGTSMDLEDVTFTSGKTTATFSGTSASGVLTVTNGTQTAKIKLTGDYLTSKFTTSRDDHGGTSVVDQTASSPSAGEAASVQRFVAAAAALGAKAGAALEPADPGSRGTYVALAAPRLTQAP